MTAPVLAALTIGQSPRDDVLGTMADLLGGARVVQCGALDGMTLGDVDALAPAPGEATWVSRLRDGTEVRLAASRVLPRLQQCVASLETEVDLFLMLCTGDLHGLVSERPMLFPGSILRQFAAGFRPRRLGVLCPAAEQLAMQQARWAVVAPEVVIEAVSPYSQAGRLGEIAERLAAASVDLVAMDCIGYTTAMKAVVRAVVGRPVLLAATTLARVAGEIIG